MRILQVISNGYLCGGAENSVLTLKKSLKKKGHDVRVLASDLMLDDPSTFSDYAYKHIQPGKISSYYKRLWNPDSYRAIKSIVRDFKPDIIHFHTMGELSPSALFAAGSVPAILTIHGPEEYTKGLLEWFLEANAYKDENIGLRNLNTFGKLEYVFYRFIQRPLYVRAFHKHLSCIVSPSKYLLKKLVLENYGVPLQHIYNGLDLPAYKKMPNSNTITYVGRLSYVKGVSYLLRAFVEVKRSLPTAKLQLIGHGPDEKKLKKQAKELKLKDAVAFLGWQKNSVALEQFKKSRVAVIPSIWPENLPTVCIEAMAIGRPVVATKVGGIPELVKQGSTGLLVPAADASALAAALVRILADQSLANSMSTAAHERVKKFAVNLFIQKIEKLYVEVVSA